MKARARRSAIAVKVLARGKSRALRLHGRAKLSDLMAAMGWPLNSCIAVRDGVPIPSDEPLRDGDEIALLETFSGG